MKKNVPESLKAKAAVDAQPNQCWKNAADVMYRPGYLTARYVEGAVMSPQMAIPQEHAWLVVNGEIIDPTLPEIELRYFPAHQWAGDEFYKTLCKRGDMPFFRRVDYLVNGVQVEMDKARAMARAAFGG